MLRRVKRLVLGVTNEQKQSPWDLLHPQVPACMRSFLCLQLQGMEELNPFHEMIKYVSGKCTCSQAAMATGPQAGWR